MKFRRNPFLLLTLLTLLVRVGNSQAQGSIAGSTATLDPASSASLTLDHIQNVNPIKLLDFYGTGGHKFVRAHNGEPMPTYGSDWLEHTTMEFRNVSGKKISGIWINVFFPESNNGHNVIGDQIHLGWFPEFARTKFDGTPLRAAPEPEISIEPGNLFSIPILTNAAATKQLLSERGLVHPGVITFHISVVYFTDGTAWSPGLFQKPSGTPGRYQKIQPNEFYNVLSQGGKQDASNNF